MKRKIYLKPLTEILIWQLEPVMEFYNGNSNPVPKPTTPAGKKSFSSRERFSDSGTDLSDSWDL